MLNATTAAMDNSSNSQALTAAFAFGMVVNAATGAVFLYIKGHASSLWRDGLRLVLVTFLATSALWAQTDFFTTLISVNSSTGCQVAIVFASIFDQLARVSLQQAIIWAMNHHDRVSSTESLFAQGAILVRVILGGVFVGLQRPQLDSVCLTSTSILPYGFVLLTADFAFTTAVLARAISFGLFKDIQNGEPGSSRSRAAILIILGFGTWTGTSVPLMLGIRSINLIARTAVPAIGLSLLIVILTLFRDGLAPPKPRPTSPVEDANPQNNNMTRDLQSRDLQSREISTADSTRVPSRYEDVKAEEILASFRRASQFTTTALRTVPGASTSTLPVIARPGIGQAETGMGGLPVQGHFFPPIRSQTMPVSLEAKKQRSETFKKNGAKLVISSPVMHRDHEQKVLAKIPTVDLDTAVYNEKKRVAAGRIFAPSIRLASRMDLKPPPIPPKALNRSSKSLADVAGGNETKLNGTLVKNISGSGTRDISVASTSSVMLSPALEELRRRSPRQVSPITPGLKTASPRTPRYGSRPQQYASSPASAQASPMTLNAKPLPKDPPYSIVNFSIPVDARKSSLPLKHQTHNIDIRPFRQRGNSSSQQIPPILPPTSKSPASKSAKIGLPTHPRESRAKLNEEHSQRSPLDQTVMLMKTIEYKDPTAVKHVVDSIKDAKLSKSNKITTAPSPRVTSVVHRPRPIPRWPEIDRAIFPAEGSPNMHEHKRSLSSGASRNKKSVVFPDAADRLLPLPPPPKSAGTMLAGDTRSMTWDEKMDMFYPDSRSVRSSTAASLRRRSRSVPDIPILSMLLDEKVGSVSPRSLTQQTEGSARTSVATQGISNLLEDFPRPREKQPIGGLLRVNLTANQAMNYESDLEFKPLTRKGRSKNVADRRSSPVLPAEDLSLLTPFAEGNSWDDDTSNHGSIHSPVTFVNVQKARTVEVPLMLKKDLSEDEAETAASPPDKDDGMEESAVVGETPNGVETVLTTVPAVEGRQGMPEQGWHRRVGQECPTFSERRQTARPRKVPPPAPLLLSRTNLVPMAIQAQPSPLESPNHALAVIQEQLNRLEEPDSEPRDRMTLLANLETELGQQEDQWKGLRGTLMLRNSQSTMGTVTPNPDSVQDNHSRRLSLGTPTEDTLPANQKSRPGPLQQVKDSPAHSPSSQASNPTQGGIVQQGLAQDQAGYVDTRAVVPTEADIGDNFHFSSLPKSSHLLRVEDADSFEREYEGHPRILHTNPAKTLWCPSSSPAATASRATQTFLWTPGAKVAKVAALVEDDQISTAVARRRIRKHLEPLSIQSSRLWEKPLSERRFSHNGLWRLSLHSVSNKGDPKTVVALLEQQVSRPVTRRQPPRRTKRVTLLPDILESPKPIPNKRGTLGIFQFPWGEMSDIASLPERPSTMMAMPGMMTSTYGEFGANSTSFFEDYEAEEEGDSDYGSFSDSEDSEDEDEDGFDETVLWEIASLLQPSQERRSDSVSFPTEGATHQRGEDSGGLHSDDDEAADSMELVRRDNSEALRLITTNFASSETEQIATQRGQPHQTHQAAAATATTRSKNAPTRDEETPASDGPHATVTPTDTDQGPWRRLQVQGLFQREKPVVQASTSSRGVVNLHSATDAAKALSPKAELNNGSDNDGDSGDEVEFISSNHMPDGESVPRPRHRSLPGAPMTTAPSAHETGLPHVDPTFPVPSTSFSPTTTLTQAWTLNSVYPGEPPRHVSVLPVASRVLLPSADISADSSAGAKDFVFIQTVPSDSSFAPSDSFIPSSEHLPAQLPSQLAVPQHQPLLRNAYELSSFVGPMAMLWSPQAAPILRPSKGLSQPDAEIWNSYLPIETAARVLPRKAELVALESTSLWTPAPAKKADEPSHDGLWSTKKSEESKAAPPAMWMKPPVIQPVSYGLAQPNAELWATYLPDEAETPRVKQREAEPAVIESQSLWTKPAPAPVVKNDGPLWTSPKVSPKAVSFGLWEPSPVDAAEAEEEPVGLFSLNHRRSDFRTSSLSPAALHMERRPRAPLQPYPDFVFAHLWNQAPLWDAAANYAKVKEQEEIDALVLEGLFSLNHRRTNYRTTSELPAALVTKTKLRISQHTLPKLTSDSLWSVQTQAPAPVERDWLSISAGRLSRAPSVASTSTDVESVKSTSTAASSVSSADVSDKKPSRRVEATPAQWLEALQDAMAAGRLTPVEADQDNLSKDQDQDQALDSPESPSFGYQLWSKRDDMADSADDSASMWKPSSSLTNNYLVLTATPGQLDEEQLRASSETLRRNAKAVSSRPPPPVFHGSAHSAFLPAASETPRDFGVQGLWSANADAMAALEDERDWLDKSLRGGLALVQLG